MILRLLEIALWAVLISTVLSLIVASFMYKDDEEQDGTGRPTGRPAGQPAGRSAKSQ